MTLQWTTLNKLFLWREEHTPDNLAFTFLRDAEDREEAWTYRELGAKARKIAGALQSGGWTGKCVLLLYPPGPDFIAAFWGCLLAQAIAVPLYPPRSNHNLLRLKAILQDSGAQVVLTVRSALDRMRPFLAADSQFSQLRYIATDVLEAGLAVNWKCADAGADAVAFVQYTSGSTDEPRGVIVSHLNALENQVQICQAFGQDENSVIAGWLPLYHDMGLIGNVIHPLYVGARCVLMSHLAFLQCPIRWVQMISRFRASASGGPDFAYDLCTRKVSDEDVLSLDLSSWKVAFNGAEPVRHETLRRFTEKFEGAGFSSKAFSPCYGLAEATLLVSGKTGGQTPFCLELDADSLRANSVRSVTDTAHATRIVSCGPAAPGNKIVIVDPQSLRPVSPDQIGEIWVSGPSIAQGYWNRSDVTSSIFRAGIPGDDADYLRTGDLGFLSDGELFVTGRLKDLIIIRGRNYYPQDIENTVAAAHPALSSGSGAAFSIEVRGEERLIIVQEAGRGQEKKISGALDAVRNLVREQHEVQPYGIVVIRLGGIPKTSSGKIQRRVCRKLFLEGRLPRIVEWRADLPEIAPAPAAQALRPTTLADCELWLINKIAIASSVIRDNIDLGAPLAGFIDSLGAVELGCAMESEFGRAIPLSSLLGGKTGNQIAQELFDGSGRPSVQVGEKKSAWAGQEQDYPLSAGQQSLWFLHEIAHDSVAYNLSFAARIPVDIDVSVLREALEMLVRRHAALRTSFHATGNQVLQRVESGRGLFFQEIDATNWTDAVVATRLEHESDFHFNLESDFLFRVLLLRRAASEYVITFVLHHIIADLWSMAILLRELTAMYAARMSGQTLVPAEPESSYSNFVRWQQQLLRSPAGEDLLTWWKNQLAGDLPVLNLPTDRPRSSVQTYNGSSVSFRIDEELSSAIKRTASRNGVTSYTALLAAFQVLLCRYSGQEEILVGSPASGRTKGDWAGVFGYFVNTLVIRSRIDPRQPFLSLLAQVRESVLQALDHQDYPFSTLVERVRPERDASRSPLFQAMFTFQNTFSQEDEIFAFALREPGVLLESHGLVLESMQSESRGALADVMLVMAERQQLFSGFLQYNVDLFDRETIDRMVRHWRNLLRGIAADPAVRLGDLCLLDEAERRQLVTEWNATQLDYGRFVSVGDLIDEQARRTPNNIAVQFGEQQLTYSELSRRASLLGAYLKRESVGPDDRVGILMERSLEMVVALLGIWKAGGAYLPLEPDYPEERLNYMLIAARAAVVLVQEKTAHKLPAFGGRVLRLDSDWFANAAGSAGNNRTDVEPENLAYVIFTSGSTGRPKGVMSTHGGLRNKLLWRQKTFKLDSSDCLLQKTPFGFDVSVWEFFWPLMVGARLVLANPVGHRDPVYISQAIETFGVTTVHFVPSMLRLFLQAGETGRCEKLLRIFTSGESLPADLALSCLAAIPASLHNLYGPTEASIEITHWPCDMEAIKKVVPIGNPIDNCQVYVLDENMTPAPVNVPGELYLGGLGVARGYIQAPDLTAERFVPDPFTGNGARLYRTGDQARYRPDGNVEFLGRLDSQIKLRGNRIELGEIEAALRQLAAVHDAHVVLMGYNGGERLLAAVAAQPQATAAELRDALKLQLPEYMVPSDFLLLEKLPLTPNGKLDRKALLAPAPQKAGHFTGPRNKIEEELVRTWMEVLGIGQVGVEDDFFALGGHSLLAAQVLLRVKEIFHVEVPLRCLFESPTIAAISELVNALMENKAADRVMEEPKIRKLHRKSVKIHDL
jgi:amino acid adenylation domain-containing protein